MCYLWTQSSILSKVFLRTLVSPFPLLPKEGLRRRGGVFGDLNSTPKRRTAHLIIKLVVITNLCS